MSILQDREERGSYYCCVQQYHEIFLPQNQFIRRVLFSYVLGNSKAGLLSIFIHQHLSLLLFSIWKMEHTCFRMLILITFAQ